MRLPAMVCMSLAALITCAAPAVAAERPTIISAAQEDGRITVRWKLPSDEWKTDLVELGRRAETAASDGAFRDRDLVDVYPPGGAARKYTFDRVGAGTYYVHVGALTKRCRGLEDESCIDPTWSPVKRVVVPKPPPKRRYAGRTSQGRRVGFTVFEGRVRNLSIGYTALCSRGRQTGRVRMTGPGLRLRRDGTFADRVRLRGLDGSTGLVRLRGRLRGAKRGRATGTFRWTSRGSLAGACDSRTITWRAKVT
jgi:hypothetical protein